MLNDNNIEIKSAGIDIGTTTTQLVISKLTFRNKYINSKNSRSQMIDKKILYESNIYITPIIEHNSIDVKEIKKIINFEYEKSGFKIDDIDTGALIITGETAKKHNAEKIIRELAEYAGNFVVATAGPELESILSGKGSGAAKISKEKNNCIMNIDIGGGTSNIAIFKDGNVFKNTCANVGGRLVEIDPESEIVTYISKPAKIFIGFYNIEISEGKRPGVNALEELSNRMVEFLEDVIYHRPINSSLREILMGKELNEEYTVDGIMFSGGVAEYIYNTHPFENKFKHGDIGIILGSAIKRSKIFNDFKILEPTQTIRATVIGAGTQTVKLSGSTVFIDKEMLPYRNLPVVHIDLGNITLDLESVSKHINNSLERNNQTIKDGLFAMAISCPREITFDVITSMAKGISRGLEKSNIIKDLPLIIVVDKDIGKVLGQTMMKLSVNKKDIICIDSIYVEEGDYMDIGKPLSNGDTVPVVVKTLVFNH